MKHALAMLVLGSALAQDTPKPEVTRNVEDPPIAGSFEVGSRTLLNTSGNFNTYRSVVNLGEGVRLLNSDLRFRDPSGKLFNEATLSMRAWGGDPYNTARFDIRKHDLYNFVFDYRNIAYFNFLPSFANPRIAQGSLLNQNSFDTQIRTSDMRLDLFPSKRITPFLAYGRASESGRGIWAFTREGNEFPVPTLARNSSDHFRAGVNFNFSRFHLALEQGGTLFRDDQSSYENVPNPGNFRAPFLGQNLQLGSLLEAYRVRGNSSYQRGTLAYEPWRWIQITGDFIYTNPSITANYSADSRGVLAIPQSMLFANRGFDSLSAAARMPHPSGSFRIELRPFTRLRIVQHWMTDRMHNASSALLAEQYFTTGSVVNFRNFLPDRLALNQTQQQVDVFYDLTKRLTVRGGHRYTFGDTRVRGSDYAALPFQSADLSRHTALVGAGYRWDTTLRLNADYERARTDRAFFRTSLFHYDRLRLRGSYQPKFAKWRLTGDYSLIENENPNPAIRWDYAARAMTWGAHWLPDGGQKYSILAEYTRSIWYSRINIILPQTFAGARQDFQENAHSGTLLLQLNPRAWTARQPGLNVGGSFVTTGGSRPTTFFQPIARVSQPMGKHVMANAEWRWWRMNQSVFAFENFASHQLLFSLTFLR